jgi:hypothetical protein
MEEDVIILPPNYKLYNDRSIYIGTFLGGPLVAGYLAAENFKQLGQRSAVKTAWIVAIIATILICSMVFLMPGIQNVPRILIPLIYTGIAQFVIYKYQGDSIKRHIAEGGKIYSPWRAVLIGIIGAVVLVAIIAIPVFLFLQGEITSPS